MPALSIGIPPPTYSESIAGRDDMPRERQAFLLFSCTLAAALTFSRDGVLMGEEAAPQPASLHERIDALVESVSFGPAAALSDDSEFLRRVYLDLNGTIPDAATARSFLDDADPSKRAALVDRLLASPALRGTCSTRST